MGDMGDLHTVPLFINGEDVTTSTVYDVTAPSTGKVIHQASSASVDDTVRAIEAAAAAQPAWAATNTYTKQAIFLKAAEVVEARAEELAKYESDEAAAPREYSFGFDVPTAARGLRDVAGKISTIQGSVPSLADPGTSAMVLRVPYGVIVGIAPWNATFILGFRAVTYAIAAGNTAVLKASEFSPRSLTAIASVFKEAGLPDGVLNIISCRPQDASQVTKTLFEHKAVKKINFTGSTGVGRILARLAGENLKPILLELGGKAPAIVFEDADLKVAAQGCALGAFMHAGQICMSTERVLVHKSISKDFEVEFKAAIDQFFPAEGTAPTLINDRGASKNKALLDDAVSKGASVMYGDVAAKETLGTQSRPIVVKGINEDMDLYYTESFGPSTSIFEFEEESEAIRVANDTEYGLSSAIFTQNLQRGLRVAKQIESGAVHINGMSVHDEPALPHGGVKASGWGRFGASGLDEWLTTKTITFKN